jgi:hypothetical protein
MANSVLPQRTQSQFTHRANSISPHACARPAFSFRILAHRTRMKRDVRLRGFSLSLSHTESTCTQFGSLKFRGVAREADFDLKLGPIRFGNAFGEWTIDDEWPAAGSIFFDSVAAYIRSVHAA